MVLVIQRRGNKRVWWGKIRRLCHYRWTSNWCWRKHIRHSTRL